MLPESDERFCPTRITRENINMYPDVNVHDLPGEGMCSISATQRENCRYPFPRFCPLHINGDLCDKPWAKGVGGSKELAPKDLSNN
jgi:hypothetical protein